MNTNKNQLAANTKPQKSLFLFFLLGLFVLQIAFAFTIHGDIGNHSDFVPGFDKTASPLLIGQINSCLDPANIKTSSIVAPEGAFAPAEKTLTASFATEPLPEGAKIDTREADDEEELKQAEEDRFVQYEIQPGDTLGKISNKLYGNVNMVVPIIRINRIQNERAIQPGTHLKLPKAGLLITSLTVQQ
ncbi:MAG: LysM peptidoglycan-binding domain-containing protein [Candidatus Riflebacteria bacterium]|nr:LysM peptidoglycan-binding domain-containing protein [Candidatus Riflebacteria bacterium]